MTQEASAGGHPILLLTANEMFSRFEGDNSLYGCLNTHAYIRVNDTRRANSGPLIALIL